MVRHRRGRSSGGKFGMNKLLKIALFAGGAAILAPKIVPGIGSELAGAVGGFFAGGPIGAVAGYFGGPMIKGFVGGAGTGTGGQQVY